jgi:colanic acid/amylovoran biosynthesis glycosyltransferase
MRTVLIYRDEILRTNETFIKNQASSVRCHQIEYAGLEPTSRALSLDRQPILLEKRCSAYSRVRSHLYRILPFAPSFHKRVREAKPSLIHAHFSQDAIAILSLAEKMRCPLVVTLHGTFEAKAPMKLVRGVRSLLYMLRRNRMWRYSSVFICVSEFVRQQALQFGYPEDKLLRHYIGINTEFFSPSGRARDENLVLFTGRLAEKKGCEFAIRAMCLVQRQIPGARLVIVGDGELRHDLERLNTELDVKATFLGEQPSSVIRDWLQRSYVFCAPSVKAASGDVEGLPMVLAEALAAGIPVVSTYHAGIPEIIHHEETGLLAPEKDTAALAKNILSLMNNQAQWAQLSENGLALVRRDFNLTTQTEELEKIYSAVGIAPLS